MFVVANRIFVAPEYAEAFEARFRERAGEVEKQPGFVRLQILRPVSDETPYVVLTTWESREAFQAWVESEDFRRAHAGKAPLPPEAFSAPGKLEQHEVIIAAEAVKTSC